MAEYEGRFDFDGLQFRRLRNGNKIRVIVECEYDEEAMAELAKLVDRTVDVRIVERVPVKTSEEVEAEAQEEIDFGGDGAGETVASGVEAG